MPTGTQDRKFAELMEGNIDTIKISQSALDEAVEWIGSNLEPGDVFSKNDLETWAESNGYTKE
jgi:hypothetical protein